jgi:hypothetical protein
VSDLKSNTGRWPAGNALVDAAAASHELRLATRDERAVDVYRALDAKVEVLD